MPQLLQPICIGRSIGILRGFTCLTGQHGYAFISI